MAPHASLLVSIAADKVGHQIAVELAGLAVSVVALAVSLVTAWLTLFKMGTVKMTQPTVVYFGPDGSARRGERHEKIFLRTLLYCTSKRGRIIESMLLCVFRDHKEPTYFNVWVYGDDALRRGSGLFIPEEGVTTNLHFLLPFDGSAKFAFEAGEYRLRVMASLVGDVGATILQDLTLNVTDEHAEALRQPGKGLYFDWGLDADRYRAHIRAETESARFGSIESLFR